MNLPPNLTLARAVVSIGLPVYNGAGYVAESIESLLGQTYQNIELLISDNASTDGTGAICEAIARRDPRVKYERLPVNIGGVRNHTRVVERASGDFFMWASCDDRWLPTYVERCVEVLTADPGVVLAYAINAKMDASGTPIGTVPPGLELDTDDVLQRFRDSTHIDSPIEPFYGVVRLSAMRRTAPLVLHPGWDRFVLAELALMGRFRQIPEPLYVRRIHEQQSVSTFPSLRERYRWGHGTSRRRRFVWPYVEFAMFFARIALRAAPGPSVKLRCLWHVLKWCNWHRADLWDDLLGAA